MSGMVHLNMLVCVREKRRERGGMDEYVLCLICEFVCL